MENFFLGDMHFNNNNKDADSQEQQQRCWSFKRKLPSEMVCVFFFMKHP
jgi:hypothetical protein